MSPPRFTPAFLIAIVSLFFSPAAALAQDQEEVAGIQIDFDGVVSPVFTKSASLDAKRLAALAADALPADLNTPSPLRKVSLPRLEEAYRPFAADPGSAPDDLRFLAGLQRIDYVFVFPETNDLVLAGPAAGFATDGSGRVRCIDTGRPPLRLDDLLVALRVTDRGDELGCSIDPVPENLSKMIQFANANSRPTPPAQAQARYRKMAELLGTQNVRIWGVPPDSHFALALVEADYRMKLVSLELERPRVRGFKSHLSMLTPTGNAMQRWWFTPLYDSLARDEDGTAFQFTGQRAQLLSQEEVASFAGHRSDAAFTRATTQKFALHFTEKFPELAAAMPVFAELQNLIDLAVLGALIKKEDLASRTGWSMSLFLDPQAAPSEKTSVPRRVQSVVNYRRVNRGMIMGLVAGGVVIDPRQPLGQPARATEASPRLTGLRSISQPEQTPTDHPWWWD